MKLTKEEMELAKIDYQFRDFCAHLLVKSNRKHLLIQHGPMNHPIICSVIEALSDLGSISSTFYLQLLRLQIPKA